MPHQKHMDNGTDVQEALKASREMYRADFEDQLLHSQLSSLRTSLPEQVFADDINKAKQESIEEAWHHQQVALAKAESLKHISQQDAVPPNLRFTKASLPQSSAQHSSGNQDSRNDNSFRRRSPTEQTTLSLRPESTVVPNKHRPLVTTSSSNSPEQAIANGSSTMLRHIPEAESPQFAHGLDTLELKPDGEVPEIMRTVFGGLNDMEHELTATAAAWSFENRGEPSRSQLASTPTPTPPSPDHNHEIAQ